jgi:hypothetical protein
MTRPDPDVVEYHLRRLDTAACRAFVADLWAARGFETTRDGDVVVAVRGDESQVVYPVAGRRPPTPDRPVDVVVAPAGAREDADDARYLDATDLREMLLYAVDRDVAADVCTRHLGASPGELPPPLPTRLRSRGEAVASVIRSTPFVLVVALSLAVLAGATLDPPVATGDDQRGAAPTPAETPTATPPPDTAATPAVGVDQSGVTNLSALAAAHSRALETRSYTVWVDYSRPRGWEPNGTRIQRDVDIAVSGDRYLGTTAIEMADNRTPLQEVYYDGRDWYIADTSGEKTRYRHVHASGGAPDLDADPSTLRYTLVTQYLSTPETAVTERVDRDGRTYYRVVGRGRPTGLGVHGVEDYSVVAYVDSRGLVRDLTARYRRDTDDGPVDVVVEVTYGRLGTTTVTPPAWYEREFDDRRRGDYPGAGADRVGRSTVP